jgi:hypothetical protein
MTVTELNKRAQVKCGHVEENGCSVYDMRPYSCKRFECLWLKGQVDEWARPDEVSLIFDEAKPKITGKKMPLLLIEGKPGAHKLSSLQPIILELARGREAYVVGSDNVPVPLQLSGEGQ